MDDNCGCILRITPDQVISIEVTQAEILAITGETEIEWDQGSMVVGPRNPSISVTGVRIRSFVK